MASMLVTTNQLTEKVMEKTDNLKRSFDFGSTKDGKEYIKMEDKD